MLTGDFSCPACGAADLAPVIYGLPTTDAAQEAAEGLVALGGCIPDGARWQCRQCSTHLDADGQAVEVSSDGLRIGLPE